MSGMAEVLAAHGWLADNTLQCAADGCSHSYTPTGLHAQIAAHQAEMLTAAGFGPVKEAGAVALEEAADEVTTGTQEIPGNDYANTGMSDAVLWHEVRSWLRARARAVAVRERGAL